MAATEVRDNPGEHRYEITVDGRVAGFAVYYRDGDRVVLIHTEIAPSLGGQGLGGELARQALDDVARRELHVVPVCPFIADYIGKHPEFQRLVVTPSADRVKVISDD